jgi:hypothetical protein
LTGYLPANGNSRPLAQALDGRCFPVTHDFAAGVINETNHQ